ncbi:MAG: IS110 family transposase [Gammaproteobacteria bacterium]|nr:IS110 family transposase [Gammaproteobacteria bacterium]
MRRRGRPKHKRVRVEVVNPNAAGIDVGSEVHYVAVPPDRDPEPIRSFKCFTVDLNELADWLEQCGIETVAMESTGVYWIPLYQILEARGFEVILANARHVKNVPGRKTDVLDCQWLQQLHSYGLLRGSFRPEDRICVLRSYIRQRDNLVKSAGAHIQRMQKALEQMNIQLHKVITDIIGVTGIRIIEAILNGERDPTKLAQLRDHRTRSSEETIAKSLEGDWREEHLFTLRQEFELYQIYREKITECDRKIEAYLGTFESKVDPDQKPLPKFKHGRKKRQGNQPELDLRTPLYRMTGVDFTALDGFDVLTVQTIISEIGLDATKWPTEKHFSSWLGLCPNNKVTGGRVKDTRSKKVVNRAACAFRMAAQAAGKSHTALGGYYRRMRNRLGPSKANTATAHKLACIVYRTLKYGKQYVDPGVAYYEQKYRQRVLNNLKRRARLLGYELIQNLELRPVVS